LLLSSRKHLSDVAVQLLGCAILGIGIWLQVSKGAYASLAPSYNVLSATIMLILAGVLVLIVGFFGCCGAIMESKCMLVTVRNFTYLHPK